MSASARSFIGLLCIRFAATVVLVWAMTTYLGSSFSVGGDWRGIVVIAGIVTALNVIVRPVLHVILLPLHFLAGLLGIILTNVVFLWIVHTITLRLDPSIVTLEIKGLTGWIVTALILGTANWLLIH